MQHFSHLFYFGPMAMTRCYVTLALYKCKVVKNLYRYLVFYKTLKRLVPNPKSNNSVHFASISIGGTIEWININLGDLTSPSPSKGPESRRQEDQSSSQHFGVHLRHDLQPGAGVRGEQPNLHQEWLGQPKMPSSLTSSC